MQKIFSQEIRFKDENGKEFPKWEKKKLGDVLYSIPTKKYQIKSSEIKFEGKYAVIDQGKYLIAGYSDLEQNLFKQTPVIVFGDHTTVIKYIDFYFIVGADGTKILKSDNKNNIKYIYHNLSFNNIQQEGYKRHFSLLSRIKLHMPNYEEQTKIANFLSAIDEKIEIISIQTEKTELWKKGLLQKMFC